MKSHLEISILNCRVLALLCLEAAGFGGALAWAQSPMPDGATQTPAGALSYSVTNLGTNPFGQNGFGQTFGINDKSQVVGSARTADFRYHAFLWQAGKITDLGTLGGSESVAAAINNEGQVVGSADTGHGMDRHAFIWQNGRMTDLGTLGGSSSAAGAINDKGQVVGSSAASDGSEHFFIWQDGKISELGSLSQAGGFGASGINNMGQVAGTSTTGAFLWQNGQITLIGAGPGRFTYGTGLNQKGQVAGFSTTAVEDAHAFLWQNGHTTDLGPGFAEAINDKGQVVGWIATTIPNPTLWQNGDVTNLNTAIPPASGAPLDIAYAINNIGQIVAANNNTAYLLTPVNKPLAVLQFSNESWVFSAHPIGQTSGPGIIWVYNSGTVAAHFSKIQFTGTNARDFAVTASTCGAALAPFTTCKVVFDFTPTDIHDRNASLDLGDDAGGGPHFIPVIGFGSRQ